MDQAQQLRNVIKAKNQKAYDELLEGYLALKSSISPVSISSAVNCLITIESILFF